MDTVLIVDDDPTTLLLIKTILGNEGYRLFTAADGKEAQELIQKESHPITAILLDWEMPRMNGIDLLRWLKEQPEFEHTPVIMQTARDSAANIREGINEGAFYYLTKPVNRDVLLSIIRAAVVDFHSRQKLLREVKSNENPFGLLVDGTFCFRTLSEGEFLAVRIANASPVPEKVTVISELITNAIEHGNLGITYDEKTGYVTDGRWQAEVERRLALPEYEDKYVQLHVEKHPSRLVVTIEDQGKGFDHTKYLDFDEARVFDNHGRGIAMAKTSLEIHYLGKGNKVVVTIPFE
jgi:CheY-like chemotaxis protein/anti-sigma regulatory factor (Ser/Thr protein kinase)